MNQRNEIIIIGGGVIGACIAYYLSGEKHDVALVEKNQIQPAKGYSISVKRSTSSSTIPLSLVDQKVGVTPMTHSLVTGKLVSEIIDGKKPSVDLEPFRLSRFR